MVLPLAATAAYQAMSKIGASGASGAAAQAAPTGAGFGDFLTGAMKDAVGTMKTGEQAAAQQVAGKADVVNVVSAVNQAEMTLDTVMAVRDKVIQAYQTIMQMPI
jgi:flagellar hook-basal body complex protein FliE